MTHYSIKALAVLIILLVSACGGNTNDAGATTAETPASETPAPAGENQQTLTYPSLPIAKMQELYDSVDYIDFVFYYANFSMNQANDSSIKATLAHVSNEVPTVYSSCQPIGSLFFQSQGKELMQAELYFSDKCVYYIWLVNGQRTYANKMTPAGFQFYQQVFSQGAQ
ncbi:hypothetical protein [Flavilitoribacter nigricans]|uniref:Lipoprotein n=1 Tax=Flavilitoribacter nigricans (strain ATCC 23147 / DSM 23189 / NBRC 102662 / NCIMB 1420 / SS-2) TaxID=1122177 RepID=A0A2D0N4C3_FLAN2|nr:hypothetical protein [Flavilitoribacter nigricans]PHN03402.1 hypothetical protein CRP01_27345 [Flavilitoribacter nigricans DSM 23189 = NBRC 102662]